MPKEDVMEKTVKIFFACAAGAGIGSVVALQFVAWLWWLGMLAGGLAGYILYDLQVVLSAIKTAWLQMTDDFSGKATIIVLKSLSCLVVGALSLVLTVVPGLILISWSFGGYDVADLSFIRIAFLAAVFWAILSISIWLSFLMMGDCCNAENNRIAMGFGFLLIRSNPFLFYFYWLPKGIIWLLRRLPGYCCKGAKIIGQFIKTVFVLIHSNERLLCMVDAAIGVVVFHFTGNNIFLGMLAGGALGVINYEVISVRLLKLVPR
ncbi:MAG: hypothetical protein ABIJ19_00690 [Patescibacteria group bacterium]